ncbi:MAG: malate dehydrogenase [Legionellaceae bacterium]|nr:malate dehydrogenase [Legionellaceae bacterium]
MNKRVRVAITGAAGQIGYALLFRIASGQLFGDDTDIELHLLELPQALPALKGVAMELEDCAFPRLKHVECTSSLKEAMMGVHWAFLVGSVPRKQGMERADLLQVNGEIFIEQGRAINDYANSDVRVFVVGNPCNTNALIAKHHAKDVPDERFYAMMTLDELRARNQLAKKAGVDITAVTQMTVWGNHSATQFPDFYSAKIDGLPVTSVIQDEVWLKEVFVPTIQQRGAAVLKERGASSAASAANAIIRGVQHLIVDTPKGETFSMALSSQGHYGVDEGLMFSFPCRRESHLIERVGHASADGTRVYSEEGIRVIDNLELNAYSQERFDATLAELRAERQAVKDLGLLKD